MDHKNPLFRLSKNLESENLDVRKQAVVMLGEINNLESRIILTKFITWETDAEIRGIAENIISHISSANTNQQSEIEYPTKNIIDDKETLMPTDKVISILGLQKSGKTTFLSVLNLALALDNSPWRIRPVGDTIKVMSELTTKIFSQGEYPEATAVEQKMNFVVEKDSSMLGLKSGAQFRLYAADVPGEATPGVAGSSIYHDFYEQNVKGSSGIIFLLDSQHKWMEGQQTPIQGTDLYYPLFSTIIDQIQDQTESTKPYIVFCVTKIDTLDEQGTNSKFASDGYFAGIEDLAENILGNHTKARIDHAFDSDHIHWLPVSATGFIGEGKSRVSQSIVSKNKNEPNRIISPINIKPIGVGEALEWILDKLADDDEDVRIRRTRGETYADAVKKARKFFGI